MCSDYHDLPGTSTGGLSDQIWYHGLVTRIHSESILKEDGQFLVRDSISNSGDYVLTVRWKGKALHFQINSSIEKGRKMFYFEEEYFSTVTHLVNFYLAHKRAVTLTSGCQISQPVERQSDLTPKSKELEASYMHIFRPGNLSSQPNRSLSQQAILNQALRQNSLPSSTMTERAARPFSTIGNHVSVPPLSSSLSRRPLPVPLKPAITKEEPDDYCDIDYDAMEDILDASNGPYDHKASNLNLSAWPAAHLSRQFQSCFNLRSSSPLPSQKGSTISLASRPPLPPRPVNLKEMCQSPSLLVPNATVQEDLSSSELEYDDPKSSVRAEEDYNTLTKNDKSSRFSNFSDYDALSTDKPFHQSRQRDSGVYTSPSPPNEVVNIYSQVQCSQLRSFLLSKTAMECAEIITYEDVKILNLLETSEKLGNGVSNGLRQILLPTGSALRSELILRSRQLQMAVILSTITACKNDSPRILRHWISILSFLLNTQKNIYGFANIISALEAKYLKSLTWLWNSLDNEIMSQFEDCKLRYQSYRSSSSPELSTSLILIPFLQPILQIFGGNDNCSLDGTSLCTDLESFWFWLDNARSWMALSDKTSATAKNRFMNCKHAAENQLTNKQLKRLFLGNTELFDDDRFHLTVESIHKMVNDVV